MSVLKRLVEGNVYPIVFIGSGMSMRYSESFPDWNGLILNIWKKAFQDKEENNYYKFMVDLRNKIHELYSEKDKEFISYKLNIKASTIIEKKFNEQFLKGNLDILGYSIKDYFEKEISPFKMEISNIFSNLEIKPDMRSEFLKYKEFLRKTKIILTTNYDEMIEKAYDVNLQTSNLDVYIGQEGFLRNNIGYSELYKVHGSCTKAESIVITEHDYYTFEKNSTLISAKIISSLVTSPIIFLGYSLADENIRNIIRDFSRSLNKEDFENISDRIIVVERIKGEFEIKETRLIDKDLGIELTVLKTDNFNSIFDSLSNINEGVSSAFINRYAKLLKKLIIERGREGTLKTLLVSPIELRDLENNKDLRKNAAVVIGDEKTVYVYPNTIDYFIDYFSEEISFNSNIAIRYIISQQTKCNIPFWWHLENTNWENLAINSKEMDKLKARKENFSNLKEIQNKINKSNKIKVISLSKIKDMNLKTKKEIDIIAYNIDCFKKEEILEYILLELKKLKENSTVEIDTPLRRLCVIYDIKYNFNIN